MFFTGADAVPVMGFERLPKLVFLEGLAEKLPTASTCELHFRIPTAHGDNLSSFKEWMELSSLYIQPFQFSYNTHYNQSASYHTSHCFNVLSAHWLFSIINSKLIN